ncbi:MAG: hypothetical protein KKD63_11855 [Proteobacteria bacterium]|nr:hypothetical protein [Pseudomonadota bacterium]MDP2104920.1 hypothetical protein [Desulfobulbaceae bacterium]
MAKLVVFMMVMALVTSCSAGGGGISTGTDLWQAYWSDVGVERYEAVVYPAEPMVRP